MTPIGAYFAGILTLLLLLLLFWLVARFNGNVKKAYSGSVCAQICTSDSSN